VKILILGNGSAGKRWAKALQHHKIIMADIISNADDVDYLLSNNHDEIQQALDDIEPDGVVIASPPAEHLSQLRAALDYDVKAVLCEKPLAGLGYGEQQEIKELMMRSDLDKVIVAYNYLYHPAIIKAKQCFERCVSLGKSVKVAALSIQGRSHWPEWGFILDHFSHTYSIIDYITDGQPIPIQFNYYQNDYAFNGYVAGATDNGIRFNIWETVTKSDAIQKVGLVGINEEWFTVGDAPLMFNGVKAEFEAALNGQPARLLTFNRAARIQDSIMLTLSAKAGQSDS